MILDPTSFARPLVFFVNGFGDQLIAIPAIRALARLFPGRVQLMLGEGNLAFMHRDAGLPSADAPRARWKDFDPCVLDLERTLEGGAHADLFISLATWVTPSVHELARRLGARRTVGYHSSFTDPVSWDPTGNMFDRLFAIPKSIQPSLAFEDFAAPPSFSEAAQQAAEREVAARLAPGEKMLFLHAETKDPARTWPSENFAWVLANFLDRRPEYRVFVCSVNPYSLELGRHQRRAVPFDFHLELALASLRFANVFLGIDSCFLHGADLFRVPSVGLFGPTRWNEWGFRLSTRVRHISGNGSMDAIDRSAVLEALLEVSQSAE